MTEIDLQPTLVGQRLTIRPLRGADWNEMFAAAADPKIWELHPAGDRYTEPVFREFFEGALASKSAFAFVDALDGRIIGSSRYFGFDLRRREIEIGWTFLSRPYWGGAHNAEIKALMLDHAFDFVDTVIFFVGVANLRSQGAMKKIGGVPRPGLVDRPVNGTDHPHVVFEIRKDRWRGHSAEAGGAPPANAIKD